MATTTKGVFFLAKANAARTDNNGPQGCFRLVLRVLDRQGPHKVEPYEVSWHGAEAAAWWQENRSIGPGTPLDLELLNPRSISGRLGGPETHATVTRCARAPLAPSWQSADRASQQQAAPAA